MSTPPSKIDLLEQIRQIGAFECAAVDAATASVSDRERAFLASQLTKLATHLVTRVGNSRGLPPPGTLPGAGTDHIDLTAQWNAVDVAGLFVRNTLFKWAWGDVLLDAERVVHELTKAFVGTIEEGNLSYPTRMPLRLRAVSAARLVVELHDSKENSDIIADGGQLISDCIERISVRCGQYCATGRTVLWAELGRPEVSSRWM